MLSLPTIPPIVIAILETMVAILGAYFVLFWLGLVVWTFRDIRRRTHDVLAQILFTLLVLVFHFPGLLVYTMMRPATTLAEATEHLLAEEALLQDMEHELACPHCHKRVQPDFAVCPFCGERLKQPCLSCRRLLALNWSVCPYCETPVRSPEVNILAPQPAQTPEPVEAEPPEPVAAGSVPEIGVSEVDSQPKFGEAGPPSA